jgi:hypothetical protein
MFAFPVNTTEHLPTNTAGSSNALGSKKIEKKCFRVPQLWLQMMMLHTSITTQMTFVFATPRAASRRSSILQNKASPLERGKVLYQISSGLARLVEP